MSKKRKLSQSSLYIMTTVMIDGTPHTLNCDLEPDIKSLTEKRVQEIFEVIGSSIAKAMRDAGKIVNPMSFD